MINLRGESTKINIYFGKVVDVEDDKYLHRIRVEIGGKTSSIEIDKLPWYYPWYGINYLPEVDDVLPVIIFDQNFSTGFYGRVIDIKSSELTEDNYLHYLKIYKRVVEDKTVQLTYIPETGIEFINDLSKIQIETSKITLFQDVNSIIIDAENIYIGNENNKKTLIQSESTTITIEKDSVIIGDVEQEPTLLGDKTVKHLENIIKHQQSTIDNLTSVIETICNFTAIPVPMDGGAAVNIALTATLTAAKTQLTTFKTTLSTENSQLNQEVKTIQSKKTKNF